MFLMRAPLGVVDTYAKAPCEFSDNEEKRRRAMRSNIDMAATGVIHFVNELLPTDTRRQLKPALPGLDFRVRTLRNAYRRLADDCGIDIDEYEINGPSSPTFRDMFDRFRDLFYTQVSSAHAAVVAAAHSETYDDVLIERGTVVYILAQCSTGFACCRLAYLELRRLASELNAALTEFKMCPFQPTCIRAQRQDDDSDTDVDTVPEPPAAVVVLQDASQDPRAADLD